jgi:Transposase DDE domain
VERRRAQLGDSFARYLSQLDTADRQEPTVALAAKVIRLTEKLTKLKEEMGKLAVYEKQMLASPDQQISLTDPDSRSMATSGRGSGVVGYNVQIAVDTEHHLIVAHEVTNSGSDRAQLANMAKQAMGVLKTETLEAVADRGYFSSLEILACHEAGITVTLPKPQTSGAKSEGRFGKQDFAVVRRLSFLTHDKRLWNVRSEIRRAHWQVEPSACHQNAGLTGTDGPIKIYGDRWEASRSFRRAPKRRASPSVRR